jgi:integrase
LGAEKDWPVNVDKRNKNKKCATYTEQEVAVMIQVANIVEEALTRFLVGTGFRIGEAAVAAWTDMDIPTSQRLKSTCAQRTKVRQTSRPNQRGR